MGLSSEKAMGYVFSCSEDGKFRVSDINSQSVVNDYTPSKYGLKQLIHHKQRKVVILADGEGSIFIYSSNTVNLIFKHSSTLLNS